MSSKWEDDKGKGLGEQVYSGAATFGLFMAKVGAAIGTIIGLLMIGFGIKFWASKEKYDGVTSGKIIQAQCAPREKGQYQCFLKIEYFVNGTPYTFEAQKNDQFYAQGYAIEVRYNSTNPQDATLGTSTKLAGMILTGIGLFIIIAAWVTLYIQRRFKFAAAAGGVGTAFDWIRT